MLVLFCSCSIENRGSVLENLAILLQIKKVFVHMYAVTVLYMHAKAYGLHEPCLDLLATRGERDVVACRGDQ